MEITQFVVSRRNDALLVGDYGSYRKQLSRRLLTIRRKLGRTSPKGRKYLPKAPITVDDISSNDEFIHLILLTAERAWAHALYMKSMHAADSSAKAITGSTRTHIISRLQKAKKNATHLLGLLKEKATSSESQMMLEARAYYSMLLGTQKFEAQKWEASLRAYSESHIIYSFLAKSSSGNHGDIFRELLTNTVDPSIRYATYQLRLPRTLSILKIVARFIPKDSELSQSILEKDPGLLNEGSIVTKAGITDDTRDLPKTISWGKRIVKLEHANIAQALAAVSAAEQRLALLLSSATDMSSADKAAAYESVLDPSQDAVNATKMAIDELLADGVAQGDPRMQALQITRTAVGYALIGWRIGRNRVLSGRSDGAYLEPENNRKKSKQGGVPKDAAVKEESSGRKIIRLRERVVLYDNTLQSLESIKDLPGVAADQELLEELGVKRAYFASLRCLAIARSHTLLGNFKNTLALLSRALALSANITSAKLTSEPTKSPPNLIITKSEADSLTQLLHSIAAQYRALVTLQNLATTEKVQTNRSIPMIERLDEYPPNGADLTNLVIYPPRVRPLPVKPIFLDVAWNYIDYPGRVPKSAPTATVEENVTATGGRAEGKKGWFGFGR